MKNKPKKLWGRILIFVGGVLFFCTLGFLASLPFQDYSSLKKSLVRSLSKTTGLPIQIDSINFDLSQGIGLRVDGFTIFSKDQQQVLISTKRLIVSARIIPLLTGKFKIKNAEIIEPEVKIYLNWPEAKNNAVIQKKLASSAFLEKKPSSIPKPKIGKISTSETLSNPIESNDISFIESWLNDQNIFESHKTQPSSTQNLSPNETINSEELILESIRSILKRYQLTIKNIIVKNGWIHIYKMDKNKVHSKKSIRTHLTIKLLRKKNNQLDAAIQRLRFQLDKLILKGNMTVKNLMSPKGTVNLKLRSGGFSANQFKHILFFMPTDIHRKLDEYHFTGQFYPFSLAAGLPIESLKDIDHLHRNLQARASVKAKRIKLESNEWSFSIKSFNGLGIWNNNKLQHNVDIETLGGLVSLKGNVLFNTNSKNEAIPSADSKLIIKNINFSKINFPKNKGKAKGFLSGSLKISGPLFPAEAIQVVGKVEGKKVEWKNKQVRNKIKKFNINLNLDENNIPFAEIRGQQLLLAGNWFKKYEGKVLYTQDKFIFLRSSLFPKHGRIAWQGYFQAKSKNFKIKFISQNLRYQDFDKKYIQGKFDLKGQLTGNLPKEGSITRTLSGQIFAQLREGSFKKKSGTRALLTVLNPASLGTQKKRGLNFDYFGGNFLIRDGLVKTKKISLETPQLKMYLNGNLDLPTGKLEVHGKALPTPGLDKTIRAIPILGSILAGKNKEEGFIESYFRIIGTWEDPQIRIKPGRSIIEKPVRLLRQLKALGN